MNKKTIIIAPLAVLAMGLTSCNKSWASINKDDAAVKERIDAVIKMRTSLQDKTEFPKTVVMNYKSKNTYSFKNHNITEDITEERKYDIDNKYWVETSKISGSRGSFNEKTYRIYQNNAGYVLSPFSYWGKKDSTQTEDGFKSSTKDQIYNVLVSTAGYDVYHELLVSNSFDDVIKAWDTEDAAFKELGGYFKYTFVTNNKSKNIGFTIESKMVSSDIKETHEQKTEYRYENNLPTYVASTITTSTEAIGDTPATVSKEESLVTISYDGKVGQDKINLDDYIIE